MRKSNAIGNGKKNAVSSETKKAKRVTFAAFFRKYGIHFTKKHSGKMETMWSLSTSVRLNKGCRERAKDKKSICSHCYADHMMDMYSDLEKCVARNTEVLNNVIIPVEEWPEIKKPFFRFEAFGDLSSVTQVINYFNCCRKSPNCRFALWTKAPGFIAMAIKKGYAKPENLNIGVSSYYLNTEAATDRFPFVDFIFTVYDMKTALEKNININCGAKRCATCHKCYNAMDNGNGPMIINEMLKEEAKAYEKELGKRGKKNA